MTDIANLLGLTERTVLTSGGRSSVRMSRNYPTSVGDLWHACTDAERLPRWIGSVSGELHEGGNVTLTMSPPDADVAQLRILRCDAPHRLVLAWAWPGEPDSMVEVLMDAVGDGARLTLEHLALTGSLPVAYGAGWEDFLVRLGLMVDGVDGTGSVSSFEEAARERWLADDASATPDGRWPRISPQTGGAVSMAASHAFSAPRAAVWAAITDPDRLSAWFGKASGEFTLGGTWTIAWDTGAASGTVAECVPSERLVSTWAWDFEPDAPESTVTIELSDEGDRTRLTLTQQRCTAPGTGYGAGWYAHLNGLDRHLAGTSMSEPDWQADWEVAMAMLRPIK